MEKLSETGNTLITGIASVELAKEGDITFIKNDSLVSYAVSSQASAIVTPREIPSIKKPQIAVENPFMAVTRFMGVIAGNGMRALRVPIRRRLSVNRPLLEKGVPLALMPLSTMV